MKKDKKSIKNKLKNSNNILLYNLKKKLSNQPKN